MRELETDVELTPAERDVIDVELAVSGDSQAFERLYRRHVGRIGGLARWLMGQATDHMLELRYPDKKRVHNLKYFTWVEQQGKTYEEIQAQWYQPDYWTGIQQQVPEIDALIVAFNERVASL